jgi:hypothetical protein
MGFLSWVKRSDSGRQQSLPETTKKPETAKEMYTRADARDQANRTPMDRMPAEQQLKVDAIKAKLEKATQHIDPNAQTPSPATGDGNGSREAMRQNMTGQEKAAAALSPTSAQAGKTPNENAPAPSTEPPAKTQDKAVSRPQTVPRPRPSWER